MFGNFAGKELAFAIFWVVAVAVLVSVQAQAGNDSGRFSSSSKIDPSAAAQLGATLEKHDKVRIIVALASADEPEASLAQEQLSTVARRAEQRAAVQRLQARVLRNMSSRRAVKSFRNFSYLSMEVTAAELDELEAMNEVVNIFKDELWRASLNDSAPQIGADAAWTGGYTGSGQTVAIIDTGIDSSHPSLAGKVVAEACFSTGSGSSTSLCPAGGNPGGVDYQVGPGAGGQCLVSSDCSHGTHVAGIAAGSSSTYTGIAPDAYLMSIQVFSRFEAADCGGASACIMAYSSDTLRALDWIYDQRNNFEIASVNLSLGGGKYQSIAACNQANSALVVAVNNLRSRGIATVAASGNEGYTSAMSQPACVSSAISVGAVGAGDSVTRWSNSAPWLSVLAPGSSIKSSVPGGGYSNISGTSMATPHVAGAIAVMRSADQAASVDQIMAAISATGVSIRDSRNGVTTPRLQLDTAIAELIQETDIVTPAPAPAPIPEPEPEPEPEPAPVDPAVVVLVPNKLDSGQYGYRWGDGLRQSELVASFQFTGKDFDLSMSGYDVDYSREIAVYLNGDLLGYLSRGANNSLNGGDSFAIPASSQVTAENRLVIKPRIPGSPWGITNLLLSEVTPAPVPDPDPEPQPEPEPEPEPDPAPEQEDPADVVLIPNTLESGEHGYRWGDGLHKAELVVSFQFTGKDFDLSLSAFDVDFSREIAIYLNGDLLGYASRGSNNGLNGGDTFAIPASTQLTAENRLVFKPRFPGWPWGVTNLLLSD